MLANAITSLNTHLATGIGHFVAAGGAAPRDSGPGGWMPELRGILTVIIAVVCLMGSVYLIVGTNMGFRLSFLVCFSAFAGWMFIMGAIWWTYGIGLKGPEPSWDPQPGRTVLAGPQALNTAGVIETPLPTDGDNQELMATVQQTFVDEGWKQLPESAASFGQASSAAQVFLDESGALAPEDYRVVNVFDIGGERYPRFAEGSVDFLAFWHKPRYVVVEVAPVLPVREEPGRAPAPPRIDESQPHQYVWMIRNKGAKRMPAGFITVGSLIIFLISCWLLHRRDKIVAFNRSQPAIPAKV
jgi:hypothetical protein